MRTSSLAPLDDDALFGRTISSPLGDLALVASAAGMVAVLWPGDRAKRVPLGIVGEGDGIEHLARAEAQFADYFVGWRRHFDVALDARGTSFQLAVWAELAAIPFGETRSYGALAAALGRPKASRAVGAANGRNPLSIIGPCHRVIGTGGALTGFAGGMDAKRHLLALEGHHKERLP